MKAVFVNVLEASGFPPAKPDIHFVFVRLKPTIQGSYGRLIGSQTLICHSVWSFVYEDEKDHAISFSFWVFEPTKIEVARLTLPLSWYPKDAAVTFDYPLRFMFQGMTNGWAKVQIHRSENNKGPFQAEPGQLLVQPAWSKPSEPSPNPGQPRPNADQSSSNADQSVSQSTESPHPAQSPTGSSQSRQSVTSRTAQPQTPQQPNRPPPPYPGPFPGYPGPFPGQPYFYPGFPPYGRQPGYYIVSPGAAPFGYPGQALFIPGPPPPFGGARGPQPFAQTMRQTNSPNASPPQPQAGTPPAPAPSPTGPKKIQEGEPSPQEIYDEYREMEMDDLDVPHLVTSDDSDGPDAPSHPVPSQGQHVKPVDSASPTRGSQQVDPSIQAPQ